MSIHTEKFQTTPAESLRQQAESYLENAVQLGRVTLSKSYFDPQLLKRAGETSVETTSGIKITRLSSGDMIVESDYPTCDDDGNTYTASTHAELLQSTPAVVSERHYGTNETAKRLVPLDETAGNYAMSVLALELSQVRDVEDAMSVERSAQDHRIGYRQMPVGLANLAPRRSDS